jgi:hypothetical protein
MVTRIVAIFCTKRDDKEAYLDDSAALRALERSLESTCIDAVVTLAKRSYLSEHDMLMSRLRTKSICGCFLLKSGKKCRFVEMKSPRVCFTYAF